MMAKSERLPGEIVHGWLQPSLPRRCGNTAPWKMNPVYGIDRAATFTPQKQRTFTHSRLALRTNSYFSLSRRSLSLVQDSLAFMKPGLCSRIMDTVFLHSLFSVELGIQFVLASTFLRATEYCPIPIFWWESDSVSAGSW